MQKCLDIRGSLGSHKLKSGKKLNAIFCILAHILSNIGSILIKFNVVCPAKLEKFNESNIFKFQRSFRSFWVCFTTAAFDTDTFQHAILDQNEGQIILYPVI